MPHNLSPFNFQFSPPSARHYHPTLSIWLSVDPMADKYPGLSPYTYCANNPVRLVDVDGRDIWIVGEDGNEYRYSNGFLFATNGAIHKFSETSFEGKAAAALSRIKESETGYNLVSAFENEEIDICIQSANNRTGDLRGHSEFSAGNDIIFWNENGTDLCTTDGLQKNAVTDLGHEFSHAYDNCVKMDYIVGVYDGLKTTEWMACYRENRIRSELGIALRISYDKEPIRSYWYPHLILDYTPASPEIVKDNAPFFPSQYLIHP